MVRYTHQQTAICSFEIRPKQIACPFETTDRQIKKVSFNELKKQFATFQVQEAPLRRSPIKVFSRGF